jgi:ABC-type Zn uptake system ZnuABC Zn-binding protein ZnuA
MRSTKAIVVFLLAFLLSACTAPSDQIPDSGGSGKFKVVATTTLVGDVVRQIAGDSVELSVLLPAGADPHGFEPVPQDIARVATADLIFANGLGLEAFLDPLIRNAGGKARLFAVSDGVKTLNYAPEQQSAENAGVNPHVWFDPNNVIIWTEDIEKALTELDPAHQATYAANASTSRDSLKELDRWITAQVAQIPADRRKLVTDHQVFGYFAERYGFEQVGVLYEGFSSLAEPSAKDLAALQKTLQTDQVTAIFVGTTVNPVLAQRLADDLGIQLVRLYTDSLTPPGGEADSYLALMRYDINALVEALKSP